MIVINFVDDKFPQFFMENVSFFKRFLTNKVSANRPSFSGSKTSAVECFAARALSPIPGCWIEELLRLRGTPVAMPMYGYLFLIDDKSVDEVVGRKLAEFDFGTDVERQQLIDCGWRVIRSTGLFALPLDGRILIGIDGVGYDFFQAHWEPLYDFLGYKWHLDD